MAVAEIMLSEDKSEALRTIAQRTGRSEAELLREAVDQYIDHHRYYERRMLLRQARGMWKDRSDLPNYQTMRDELDRTSS